MSILPEIQAQKNFPIFIAQTTPPSDGLSSFLASIGISPNSPVMSIIIAVATLVIGWAIALIAGSTAGKLLKRTDADNRLARWFSSSITGTSTPTRQIQTEKWIARIVFWLVMAFVVVAFLQVLGLTTVAAPINKFLEQLSTYSLKIGAASILLGIAWLLATVSKSLVLRSLQSFQLEERLNEHMNASESRVNLSETLATALYWLIFLLFLPLILEALELKQTLAPVQNLAGQFLDALPKIVKAIAIGGIGWLIAVVVRQLVTNLLSATGIDSLVRRFGLSQTAGISAPSGAIGTIVYALILIPVAISVLESLELKAVSAPASQMLQQALTTLPQIFMGVAILAIAYFTGQFVNQITTNILTGIGFNGILPVLGLPPIARTAEPNLESVADTQGAASARTPSEIVGIIAFVAIVLFGAITATNVLGIPALTSLLRSILDTSGQILGGLIVFAIGLYLANLAFNLVNSTGTRQSRILGHTARICIIAFSGALGLRQMGIATDIVALAFGLLLGAIAVAIAIAFGLGGRDIAAEQIREWLSAFKARD
ncbi:MAG: mechanosensitive ion channel [Pseudanabaena sp. CRU_2_10]|nr:mechanosensitive ion channel [Pseudanabaena sp. CRU_2_10]